LKESYESEEKGDLLIIRRKTKSRNLNLVLPPLVLCVLTYFAYLKDVGLWWIIFIWGVGLLAVFKVLLEREVVFDNINKKVLKGEKTLCSYDEIEFVYPKKGERWQGGEYVINPGHIVTFKLKDGKEKRTVSISSGKIATELVSRISKFASLTQGGISKD
jgi:hypothetical protein